MNIGNNLVTQIQITQIKCSDWDFDLGEPATLKPGEYKKEKAPVILRLYNA